MAATTVVPLATRVLLVARVLVAGAGTGANRTIVGWLVAVAGACGAGGWVEAGTTLGVRVGVGVGVAVGLGGVVVSAT